MTSATLNRCDLILNIIDTPLGNVPNVNVLSNTLTVPTDIANVNSLCGRAFVCIYKRE